ncbi:MAG: hypothetical protein E6K12_10215 [Methanobacteriota archaeon]|nr:MAG: hypothetical protein E6K12_10215 [Euryarchaeota archaeon]
MQKKMLYALVAVIVVVLIVAAVAVVVLTAPPRKLTIQLWYNSDGHYGDTEPAVAQVLKSSLEATGKLSVELKSEPWATYISDVGKGRLPFYLLGWYPDYFDSDDYISPFLSTSGAKSRGTYYNDSQMNTWISDQAAASDPTVRAGLFTQIQNKLAADVPYIPLWQTSAHVVYDKDISNVYLHPVVFKWFIMSKTGATTITGGTTDRVVSFDPAKAYDYFSGEVINQIFDTLLVYEPKNATLMPGLATRIPTAANGDISADGLSYTFHLKSGVKFHDGSDFNSTVMKWSIERAIKLDLDSSAAFLLYDTAKLGKTPVIDTPDPLTITFHLSQKVGFFNDIMAYSVAAPVSMVAYNNTGQQTDAVSKVVGTGPYKLTNYVPNQVIELSRDPNYYNPGLYASFGIPSIPVLDKVTLTLYSTATNLKQAIETHAVNVAYRTLNPTDVTDLKQRASTLNVNVDLGSNPQIRYLCFNVPTSPYSDVRLRQAIAYAVNRTAISSVVFSNLTTSIFSMIPPSFPFTQPVFQTVYGTSPNLTQAKSLLSQLGYSVFHLEAIARVRS